MIVDKFGRINQFRFFVIFAQVCGLLLSMVYLLLIGPNEITDSLTILTLYSQAPIAILSFGAFYSYILGKPGFNNWRIWQIIVGTIGLFSPILGFPQVQLAFENKSDTFLILSAFCFSACINGASSILIVKMASAGKPNWLAAQSIGNSLSLSLAIMIPILRLPYLVLIFMVTSSLFQYFLIVKANSRIKFDNVVKTNFNNDNFKSTLIYQCIRSAVGYLAPIFLLISLAEMNHGLITLVAILSKIVQAIINWTANALVHTSTNIYNRETFELEIKLKRYARIYFGVIITSEILVYSLNIPFENILVACQFWAFMCVTEVIINRMINLSGGVNGLKKSLIGSFLGYGLAYVALINWTSVSNYYYMYAFAIFMATIAPGWNLVSFDTRKTIMYVITVTLLLNFFSPIAGLLFVLFSFRFIRKVWSGSL